MEGRVKKLFTPVTSSASVRLGLQALSVKSVSIFLLAANSIYTAVYHCVKRFLVILNLLMYNLVFVFFSIISC